MTSSINGNEELFKDIDELCGLENVRIQKAIECLNCPHPATNICAYCNHGLNIQ